MRKLLLAALSLTVSIVVSGPWLPITAVRVAEALPTPSGALSPAPLNSNFLVGSTFATAPTNYNFENGLTGWTTISGSSSTLAGGQSGNYLSLSSGEIVSEAFTLSGGGTMWTYYVTGSANVYAKMFVLSGPTFGTATQVDADLGTHAGWEARPVDLAAWAGQTIEIRYQSLSGTIGFDEGAWRNAVPNWTISGIATSVPSAAIPATTASLGDYQNNESKCSGAAVGAVNGPAVTLFGNEAITSLPFTIPGDTGRLPFHIGGIGQFLSGPSATIFLFLASENYGTTHVVYSQVFNPGQAFYTSCDVSQWAGQTAKITIASTFGGGINVVNAGGISFFAGGSGNPGEQQNPDMIGEPVSAPTGALTHSHTDVQVPGKGVPLEFTRSYSSAGLPYNGSLGFGWTHNYDGQLTIFTDGSVSVRYPGGAGGFFTNTLGILTPPRGINDALVKNGDNTYTLTTTRQMKYNFDAAGKFTSIRDRNNNTTSLTYNGSGYLSTVTDPGGRLLTFTPDASGRITLIADPLSRTVGFAYDANGDLTTVTDVKSGTTTYGYSNHRLTTLTDSLAHTQTTSTYDTANRVVEQLDAVGGYTCYYYGAGPTYTSAHCPALVTAAVAGQTIMVDPRGNKQLHQFDTSFRPTGIERTVDGVDIDTVYAYETDVSSCSTPVANNGRLCSATDPLGHVTSYAYDAKGNVLTITDPLSHVQHYTYTALNDVLVADGPRTDVTDTTTYGYDGPGKLITITDAFSKVTALHYDDPANPGLVTSIVEPDTAGDPVGSHITTFTYDAYGNRSTVKDALNNTTTSVFDLGGRVTSTTDAMTPSRTTLFTYDPQNHLLTVQDPYNGAAAKTIYTYDAVGNRKTVTNARGNTTTYDYDNKNRLITVTDPLLPTHRVTRYTYDANDNLATLKDAKQSVIVGGVVTYTYDAADRLKKIAYPDIHYYTDYTYDAAGRRLTMTDTRGRCDDVLGCAANATQSNTTTYTYDNANLLATVQTTFSGTQLVQYGYDQANNRSSITYPDGKIASYTFDARNRMQTVGASWTTGTTQYFYDNAGRLDYATLPATTGVTEDYGYDVADRLTSVTNTKAGVPPTTLSYANYVLNSNGNRSQLTDTTGVTGYNYDVLDRLSSATYPSAPTTTAYTYDGVGNRLTQQVDANPATVNTYDEADQLKTIGGVTNGYDLNGNLLTIGIGGSLPNTFLYDQENRLFRTGPCRADVNGDGLVNSTDQLVIGKHTGNQGSTPFDLNTDLNEDLSVNSTDALFASMESGKNCKGASGNGRSWYDGDGLRVRQRTFMPTGAPFDVNDDYVWDTGAGLPVVLQDARRLGTNPSTTTTYLYGLGLISETSGAGVASYYLADGLGSTTQLTDSAGAITDSYSYDVFGAPRTTTGTTANNFQYTGQQRDGNANRGLYFLRARSYDPALGRFLQQDPLPFVNRYSYTGNNAANLTDPSGLFPCPGCGKLKKLSASTLDAVSATGTGLARASNAVTGVASRFATLNCLDAAISIAGLATSAYGGTIVSGAARAWLYAALKEGDNAAFVFSTVVNFAQIDRKEGASTNNVINGIGVAASGGAFGASLAKTAAHIVPALAGISPYAAAVAAGVSSAQCVLDVTGG